MARKQNSKILQLTKKNANRFQLKHLVLFKVNYINVKNEKIFRNDQNTSRKKISAPREQEKRER